MPVREPVEKTDMQKGKGESEKVYLERYWLVAVGVYYCQSFFGGLLLNVVNITIKILLICEPIFHR